MMTMKPKVNLMGTRYATQRRLGRGRVEGCGQSGRKEWILTEGWEEGCKGLLKTKHTLFKGFNILEHCLTTQKEERGVRSVPHLQTALYWGYLNVNLLALGSLM